MSNIIWQGPILRYRNMYSVYSSPMPAISTSCKHTHCLHWNISFDSLTFVFQYKAIGHMFWWSKFSIMIHFVSSSCILSSDRQLAVKKNLIFPKNTSVCVDTRGRKMAFFLLCMILHAVAADPSITCFQDSEKCEVSSDNLIEVFVETTWEECSLLCQDNLSCLAFNFFGPESRGSRYIAIANLFGHFHIILYHDQTFDKIIRDFMRSIWDFLGKLGNWSCYWNCIGNP